jgi:hypothetical protein
MTPEERDLEVANAIFRRGVVCPKGHGDIKIGIHRRDFQFCCPITEGEIELDDCVSCSPIRLHDRLLYDLMREEHEKATKELRCSQEYLDAVHVSDLAWEKIRALERKTNSEVKVMVEAIVKKKLDAVINEGTPEQTSMYNYLQDLMADDEPEYRCGNDEVHRPWTD